MRIPTIHLNGTGGTELLRQFRDARRAVQRAMDTVANAAPHGRDYYPQSPEALPEARRDYESRQQRLQSVYDELAAIEQAIDEALAEREHQAHRRR